MRKLNAQEIIAAGIFAASVSVSVQSTAQTYDSTNAVLAVKIEKELPKGRALPCADKASLKSISSFVRMSVTYQNDRTQPVSLWWINENGKEVSYANILAGKSDLQAGSFTSFWVIKDMAGRCVEIIQPGTATSVVHIR
jgi:hypothetical protein